MAVLVTAERGTRVVPRPGRGGDAEFTTERSTRAPRAGDGRNDGRNDAKCESGTLRADRVRGSSPLATAMGVAGAS